MSQCASSSWLMPCPLRVGHHSTRKPILLQGFIHSDVEAFWFGYNVWTARWWLACPNTWGTTKQNHAFEWERSQKATIKRFKWQFSKKEIYIGEHTGMSQISGTRVFTSTYPNRFCYGYSPHQPLPKVMGSIPSLHHFAHQHLCQLGPSHATLGFGYRAGLVARCRCHDVMGKRRKKIIEDVMAEFPCLVRLPGGSCCRASEILLHHLSHIWASRSLIDCLSMSWKNLCASTQHKTGSKIFNSHNSAPNFHQVKMPPMLGWFPLCGPHHLWWPRSHFARIYQPHRRVVPNIT